MADDLITFDGGVLVADMLQEATTTDASDLTQYAIEDGSLISDHLIRQPQTLSLTLVQTETPIAEVTGFARVLQQLTYASRSNGAQQGQASLSSPKETAQPGSAPVRQPEFRPTSLLALGAAVQSLLFGDGPKEIRWTGLGKPSETNTELKWTGLKTDGDVTQKSLQVQVLSAGAPVARVNAFHDALVNLMRTATPCIVTVKGRANPDLVLISVGRTDSQGQVGRASFSVQFKQIATVETQTVKLPPVPKAKAAKNQSSKPPQETTEEQKARLRSLALQLAQSLGLQQ